MTDILTAADRLTAAAKLLRTQAEKTLAVVQREMAPAPKAWDFARALRLFAGGVQGDVYISTFSNGEPVIHTGPNARAFARSDVSDAWDSAVPTTGYLTTLVISPSGEVREDYLF